MTLPARSRHIDHSRCSARLRSERGLTLVEIIIVLVILGVLMTFLTGKLFSSGESAKAGVNNLKMKKLQGMVNQYQLMNNVLPPDLHALVGCPDGQACIPIAQEDDLKDVWGTPFGYSLNGNQFTIKSLGSDRKDGGSGVEGDATLTGP